MTAVPACPSPVRARLSLDARLPSVSTYAALVEAGVPMGVGPDPRKLHRSAARCVDRILKGAKPADLAAKSHSVVELVVNLAAARGIDLAIPRSVMSRADEVIR